MKLPAMLVGCMPSAGPGTTRRTIPRARVDAPSGSSTPRWRRA
ncbi:MAG: hypothetical protein U1F77_14145 [Kiritimatiellia bacterium]